jgi:hypothetical protein
MGLIERFYEAAARSGLLTTVEIAGQSISVDFSAADETVLEGLVRGADYSIRYPAAALPQLAVGDALVIAGINYTVRDIRAIGDGSEHRADLSRA